MTSLSITARQHGWSVRTTREYGTSWRPVFTGVKMTLVFTGRMDKKHCWQGACLRVVKRRQCCQVVFTVTRYTLPVLTGAMFTGSVDWRPWTRPANTNSVYQPSVINPAVGRWLSSHLQRVTVPGPYQLMLLDEQNHACERLAYCHCRDWTGDLCTASATLYLVWHHVISSTGTTNHVNFIQDRTTWMGIQTSPMQNS